MSMLKKKTIIESKSTNLKKNFVMNVQLTRFRFRNRFNFCVRLIFFSIFLKRWYFFSSLNSSFRTKKVIWAVCARSIFIFIVWMKWKTAEEILVFEISIKTIFFISTLSSEMRFADELIANCDRIIFFDIEFILLSIRKIERSICYEIFCFLNIWISEMIEKKNHVINWIN